MSEPQHQSTVDPSGAHGRRTRWVFPLLACAATVVMIVRAAATIGVFSDTTDEAFHIGSAVAMVQTGRATHGLETPPVARLVQGVALVAAGVELPAQFRTSDRAFQANTEAFDLGDAILMDQRVPYWRTLTIARGATLLVFIPVAMLYVYLLGRWLGAPVVGVLAVVFCSTDPALLAHGALATSDSAATACFLAATYHGLRWAFEPTTRRAAACGAATGIAIGAKFTALLLVPTLPILAFVLATPLMRRRLLITIPLVAAVTFVTLWSCYLFDVGRLSEFPPLADGRLDWFPRWLVERTIPMPGFPLGLAWLRSHNAQEQAAFLAGSIRPGGWWYYFPFALIVKSPISLVVGMLLACVSALFRVREPRRSLAILVIVAAAMLMAMASNIQIGVRHLLPVIPLLYVLVTAQLARSRREMAVLLVLIAGAFAETAARHPDYLSFFNVAAHRACGGRPLLLDSNLDWGQDLARLSRWLRDRHPSTPFETRVFARKTLADVQGFRLSINEKLDLRRGLFIVSKNVKHGLYPTGGMRPDAQARDAMKLPEFVHTDPPDACIGDSLEVYELPRRARPN